MVSLDIRGSGLDDARPRIARALGQRLRGRGSERVLRRIYSPELAKLAPLTAEVAAWDGTRLHVDTSSYIEWMTFVRGGYERDLQLLMHRLLRPGDTAIDIGANVGIHTCSMARRVGAEGRVVAIEPLVELAERIEANVLLNGLANVKVVRAAASCATGTAEIFPPIESSANKGQGSLHARTGLASVARIIETDTIDRIIADLGATAVRLIKIDVEGHEFAALRGAEATIREFQPRILFEYDAVTYAAARVGWTSVERFFAGLGYRLGQVTGAHVRAVAGEPVGSCMVMAVPRA